MWGVDLGFDSPPTCLPPKLLGTAECGRRPTPSPDLTCLWARAERPASCRAWSVYYTSIWQICSGNAWVKGCPIGAERNCDRDLFFLLQEHVVWVQHVLFSSAHLLNPPAFKCPWEWSLKIQIIQSISLCDTSPHLGNSNTLQALTLYYRAMSDQSLPNSLTLPSMSFPFTHTEKILACLLCLQGNSVISATLFFLLGIYFLLNFVLYFLLEGLNGAGGILAWFLLWE